jgi:hypothetical protein
VASWIPVIVAAISAAVAGWFAIRAKRWEARSLRLIELERRAAVSKEQVFHPLIDGIGDMWARSVKDEATPEWFEENVLPRFIEFMKWGGIYASDDLVWTMHRYMQAIFHDAPPNVVMRLLTELTISLRRELGNPDTKVTALDLTSFRINDIYGAEGLGAAWARLPEPKVYEAEGWTPPWGKRFRYGRPLRP